MAVYPPISQADIDNGTVFNTRGGHTATVVNFHDSRNYPWRVKYVGTSPVSPVVTKNGQFFVHQDGPLDLVSRVPQAKPGLSTPISQADVDNGTVFRTRGGGKAKVISKRASYNHCPWNVKYASQTAPNPIVTDNGRYYWHDAISEFDLMERVPQAAGLQPPISQADIDNGTEFVSRDGRVFTISAKTRSERYPWILNGYLSYTADGQYVIGKSSEYDLVFRRPVAAKSEVITPIDFNSDKPVLILRPKSPRTDAAMQNLKTSVLQATNVALQTLIVPHDVEAFLWKDGKAQAMTFSIAV